MEKAKLVLEYIRVFLTAPLPISVVAAIVIFWFAEDIKSLLLRVAKITLPGGMKFSTPQKSVQDTDETKDLSIGDIPSNLTLEQRETIDQIVKSYLENARLWEFRYLNFFLVRETQAILDWFIAFQNPIAYAHYDSIVLPFIPSTNQRQTIINVLQGHYLVTYDQSSGMITVTPKGLVVRQSLITG